MDDLKEYIDKKLQQLRDDLLINTKRVLDIEEAAKYLGYTKDHIYRLVNRGEIPFSKPKNTKKLWFDRVALDNWRLGNSNEVQLTTADMMQKATDSLIIR